MMQGLFLRFLSYLLHSGIKRGKIQGVLLLPVTSAVTAHGRLPLLRLSVKVSGQNTGQGLVF